MSITDWLFSTCGKSHIGIYVCSKCGYQLVRSSIERSVISKSSSTLKSLLPPTTIAARSKNGTNGKGDPDNENGRNGIRFDTTSMLEDFTKNANLGRVFHKDSMIMRRILGEVPEVGGGDNQLMRYKLSCGKCGRSLGHQIRCSEGQSKFEIRPNRVDLTFRKS